MHEYVFKVVLKIEAKETMECDNLNYDTMTEYAYFSRAYICEMNDKAIYTLFVAMFQEIGNLIYCNVDCAFYSSNNDAYQNKMDLRSILNALDSVEVTNPEPCCVCGDDTLATTMCNHTLCIPCADKTVCINHLSEESIESYKANAGIWDDVPCPICRGGGIREMNKPRVKFTLSYDARTTTKLPLCC